VILIAERRDQKSDPQIPFGRDASRGATVRRQSRPRQTSGSSFERKCRSSSRASLANHLSYFESALKCKGSGKTKWKLMDDSRKAPAKQTN
jgi:hypothetical protein